MSSRTLVRIMFTLGVTIACVGKVPGALLQKRPAVSLKEQQVCEQAAIWVANFANPTGLFGGASQGNHEGLTWREFQSEADLGKVAGQTVFDFASVYTLPSGGLYVETITLSLSGDPTLIVDYCFRPSGTVVRILSDSRGPAGFILETFEFGTNAEQLATRATYYDRGGAAVVGKAANPVKEWKARFPTPVYRKVIDLPFYPLLEQRK